MKKTQSTKLLKVRLSQQSIILPVGLHHLQQLVMGVLLQNIMPAPINRRKRFLQGFLDCCVGSVLVPVLVSRGAQRHLHEIKEES